MDTCSCHIEVPSDERLHGRYVVSDHIGVVISDIGDRRGVHSVSGASERSVFHYHRLQRGVACSLSYPQQRAVHRARAVKPCGGGVCDRLVEIVVPVPLQMFALDVGVVLQTVDDTGHASGKRRLGVGHSVAHRVAGPYLYRNARVLGHLHQLIDEGHHESVEIGPGHVLQMASGHNPLLECHRHCGQVLIHGLLAGHVHFLEDVVVAAGDQDAGLRYAQVSDQLIVFFFCPYPCGDLREREPEILASGYGFPVLLAVNEELRLPDYPERSSQSGYQFEQVNYLINGIRLDGLLAVPKRRVGDPYLVRHADGDPAVVECHPRDLFIVVDVPVKIGFRHILQLVSV